mgnify:FL=1
MKSKFNKEYLKLIFVVAVLLIILFAFIIYVSYPLLSVKKAVLATQPIDPFDPLRGQYVVIRYEINSIPLVQGAKVRDSIYVTLVDDGEGISRYVEASLNKPSKDKLFIRGEAVSIDMNTMRVEYGIEQYFFERGARFESRVSEVEVKLSDSGASRINQLLSNGEPVKIIYENKTWGA